MCMRLGLSNNWIIAGLPPRCYAGRAARRGWRRAADSGDHCVMSKALYLASQSPRRLELLRQIGFTPTVLPLRQAAPRADVDETPLPGEKPRDYVLRLARLKAQAAGRAQAGRRLPPWPVVAADTCVVLDGDILGKPRDADEAAGWLRRYAGRSHTVLTAVAVLYAGRLEASVQRSTVRFAALSDAAVAWYLASGEPFDKAGGYGIQGRAAAFIEHLSGSYSGVMGLPLYETVQLFEKVGIDLYNTASGALAYE